uniref:7-dehydrocholesterol reductase n=1 Tax=Macrostomum lignano TaxID=282301 RepID=A0A1I8JS72_9PLAT
MATKQLKQAEGPLVQFINRTVIPLLLILLVPQSVMYLWYASVHCQGSLTELADRLTNRGGPALVLLMLLVPGRTCYGTETPTGHVPEYKDNGFACYLITMATFLAGTVYLKQRGLTPTKLRMYDYGDFLASMILLSLAFCLLLCVKGVLAPTSTDHGRSGNYLICGIDIKVFTNCRFGLTVWALAVAVFALKSYELHGRVVDGMAVTAALQLLYLTKFFWWEAGYYRTIDIITDRAGFYICWGCLCFVPSFYTLVSLFMVRQPEPVGPAWTAALLGFGLASLAVNYWSDWQKQAARAADGQLNIWGRPARVIRAKYSLENGQERQSVLLASGFWAVSRHFHYIPELSLTLCWSAVCGTGCHIIPYMYFAFLSVLLFHRSFRDDKKCRDKYGKYWSEYCKLVPYKIVPFLSRPPASIKASSFPTGSNFAEAAEIVETMYGILLEGVQHYLEHTYGAQAWAKIRELAECRHPTFETRRGYNEHLLMQLFEAASSLTGLTNGCFFVGYLAKYGYDKVLRVMGRHLRDFYHGIDNLHEHLRFSYPRIRPPTFIVADESPTGAERGPAVHPKVLQAALTPRHHSRHADSVQDSPARLPALRRGQLYTIARVLYQLELDIGLVDSSQQGAYSLYVYELRFDNVAYSGEHSTAYRIIDPDSYVVPYRDFITLFPYYLALDRSL